MVRQITLSKFESKMHKAWLQILITCLNRSKHPNDIIVCSQNGFFGWNGEAAIGLGEDGLASYQSLNHITREGLKYLTDEEEIVQEKVYETNSLEDTIHFEMKHYQNIWENILFLRVLTQIVNIGNGEHYDWSLSMLDIQNSRRIPEHIRKKIRNRLNVFPLFKQIFDKAYISQIRNASAHSQYQVVQGGIIFHNYKSDKYSTLQGVTFEQWEEIYCSSYSCLYFITKYLRHYESARSQLSNLPHNAVEIITPGKDSNWYISHIAPTDRKKGDWRFVYFD